MCTNKTDKHLCPKSVLPWQCVERMVQSNWQVVFNILGSIACLELPSKQQWMPKVTNEATACQWLDNSATHPAINIITALYWQVQSNNTMASGLDEPLFNALCNLGSVWEEHKQMCHFWTAQGIDLTIIGCAVESDTAFHGTWAGSDTTNLVLTPPTLCRA